MDFDKDVAIKRLFNKIYLLYLDYKIKLESINNVALVGIFYKKNSGYFFQSNHYFGDLYVV